MTLTADAPQTNQAAPAASGRVTATQTGNDPAMIAPIAVGGRIVVRESLFRPAR